MLITLYCAIGAEQVSSVIGDAEYSYYYVFRQYEKALQQHTDYDVVSIHGSHSELAQRFDQIVLEQDQPVVCLCFTPPHRLPANLPSQVIVVPVFAWEFNSLPEGMVDGERGNWPDILLRYGGAITHSKFTVDVVKERLGQDYPIVSIPSPVWDDYAHYFNSQADSKALSSKQFSLQIDGFIFDSQQHDVCDFTPHDWPQALKSLLDQCPLQTQASVTISGVVYLTVMNPYDGRKNWPDMVKAFCWQHKHRADATLLIKLTTRDDIKPFLSFICRSLYQLGNLQCRVVVLHGYLEDDDYTKMVCHSHFVVNTSHGEGQCLPLMEGMSAGKPALAPNNSAMRDYINDDNAFIIRSDLEPTFWPHDPRQNLRAQRFRLDWESICGAFEHSYHVLKNLPEQYSLMAKNAYNSTRKHCSNAVATERLSSFLVRRTQKLPNKACLDKVRH